MKNELFSGFAIAKSCKITAETKQNVGIIKKLIHSNY